MNLNLGLMLIPVSRNSIFNKLLNIPYEKFIGYHVILGYSFMILGVSHMSCFWKVYDERGFFPHDILNFPMFFPDNGFGAIGPFADNFTI